MHPFEAVLLSYAWAVAGLTVLLVLVMAAQRFGARRRRRRTGSGRMR